MFDQSMMNQIPSINLINQSIQNFCNKFHSKFQTESYLEYHVIDFYTHYYYSMILKIFNFHKVHLNIIIEINIIYF